MLKFNVSFVPQHYWLCQISEHLFVISVETECVLIEVIENESADKSFVFFGRNDISRIFYT